MATLLAWAWVKPSNVLGFALRTGLNIACLDGKAMGYRVFLFTEGSQNFHPTEVVMPMSVFGALTGGRLS